MTTKLDKSLRRELHVKGKPYVLTISPQGFKLVAKGRRKGYELEWESFVSGETALATALNATLHLSLADGETAKPKAKKRLNGTSRR